MKFRATLILVILLKTADAQQGGDTVHRTHSKTSILLDQLLDRKYLKNNLVRIETVTFPPGHSSKKHTHPCPVFVYIIDGELISEFEGIKKIYKAGDVFYEKPNGVHSITKNNSSSASVTFLVFYLMKEKMDTYLPLVKKN
ncbi:MAG: cupin domain-containing protein [Mucilaginibacter sp.]